MTTHEIKIDDLMPNTEKQTFLGVSNITTLHLDTMDLGTTLSHSSEQEKDA